MTYKKLNSIARKYDPTSPKKDFDWWLIQFDFETLRKYFVGEKVIEMGCGRGVLTAKLAQVSRELLVIEGAKENIQYVKRALQHHPRITFQHVLWENVNYRKKDISDVVFFMGLEHIDVLTARKILRKIKTWLRPGGRLHIAVPNANSLHRKVAWYAGMIKDTHELSERDKWGGHKRVYDREMLFRELEQCGYTIVHWEGILLKPLTNAMLMHLDKKILRGFYNFGRELPDYCAHLYMMCEARGI